MGEPRFKHPIRSVAELEEIVGTPAELVVRKQLDALDESMRGFIALSPFAILGTHNRQGHADVSPRGDGPGFVRVLDSKHLLLPERPGNKRADSLRNILETHQAGLMFLIPGNGETLRVNGGAELIRDEDLLAPLAVNGKTPRLGIVVEVRECYLHCARATLRSKLWQKDSWPDPAALPRFASILAAQVKMREWTEDRLSEMLEKSYRERLY